MNYRMLIKFILVLATYCLGMSQLNAAVSELQDDEALRTERFINRGSSTWEEEFMIIKGFRMGIVKAQGLTLKNKDIDYSLNSGPMSGIEIGWAIVPKKGVRYVMFKSLGVKARIYSLTSTFNEDPVIGSKQFVAGAIDLDGTYALSDRLYISAGLNLPRFGFKLQSRTIDFESKVGLNLGAGYEVYKDITIDLQYSQHNFNVNEVENFTISKDVVGKYGDLKFNVVTLALAYTF